jgi:hypothetical protein
MKIKKLVKSGHLIVRPDGRSLMENPKLRKRGEEASAAAV